MARQTFPRFTRGLRFRLMASYATFFAVLLILVSLLFRERLASSLNTQGQDVLEQEWAAMKGYLHIEANEPHWYFDANDPDESLIVRQIQRVYLLTDAQGNEMQHSTIYESIPTDPAEIRSLMQSIMKTGKPVWLTKYDSQGNPFQIRAGVTWDERHHTPYFVAIGRSLRANDEILQQYTWIYVGLIPGSILAACLLGWVLAGRALKPVTGVALTAQRISGSNLSLRIPTRGARDELDYLIETFNRMIERLENSFQQIRQFSTDVSHELRTPITVIRGQLEVALFTANTVEQYREAILNSLQDIERLSQIVRALLLLSQAESGQLALQKTRLDLTRVVRDIVDQFQIVFDEAQVRLETSLEPECPADADRVQIERMLSNLVSNAVKFTPAGGEVRVTLRCEVEQAKLIVEDTGCGIPKEHLPHIFDRFYRVRGQEAAVAPEKGLGLGLSFVAWIAKAHGGSVSVESEPGKGSRFTVTLPVPASAALPATASDEAVGSRMNEV